MRFSSSINRLARVNMGALAALAAIVVASLAPAIVSAAQLSERSIALSSSSKGATGVTYTVNFTPTVDAAAFDLFFCTESPITGDACTAPSGMVVTSAASESDGVTAVSGAAGKIEVTDPLTAGTAASVAITGITNPSNPGTVYARITTYNAATGTDSAADATATDPGTFLDEGGIALSITDSTEVKAVVQESMTFCVSGDDIQPYKDCDADDVNGAGDKITAPSLHLGQTVGSDTILDTTLATGTIYTQLSTNAASGAVISLQSSAKDCGGLVRAGADTNAHGCGIAPALTSGVSGGSGTFGVKLGTVAASAGANNAIGTLQAAGTADSDAYYNSSDYKLNYVLGNGTGVTSDSGDPFLDTNNKPVNNQNMPITFAAAAGPNTPAGTYSADLNLVATAKF